MLGHSTPPSISWWRGGCRAGDRTERATGCCSNGCTGPPRAINAFAILSPVLQRTDQTTLRDCAEFLDFSGETWLRPADTLRLVWRIVAAHRHEIARSLGRLMANSCASYITGTPLAPARPATALFLLR